MAGQRLGKAKTESSILSTGSKIAKMVYRGPMNVAELVTIGAKIAEIGETLKSKRAERDELNAEISALEKELMPLVVEHSKIIAEVIGHPIQPPAAPPPPPPNWGPRQLQANGGEINITTQVNGHGLTNAQAKQRITDYLNKAEPGTSAADVAAALRMDPSLVRQVMADIMRGAA